MSGQWHPPQTEHSGGPLGDPSARVFEVFLIVSQSALSPPSPQGISLVSRALSPLCRPPVAKSYEASAAPLAAAAGDLISNFGIEIMPLY